MSTYATRLQLPKSTVILHTLSNVNVNCASSIDVTVANISALIPFHLVVGMVTAVALSIATRQWVNALWSRDKMINQPEEITVCNLGCILTNVEQRTVIDMLTSRTKDVVSRYLHQLPDRQRIELVAQDMWQPYKDAVRDILPQATVVIDRFHVIRLAIQGMDTVRKDTRSELTPLQRRTLMRDRYILFHRKSDLNEQDQFILDTWLGQFPLLGKAYQFKEDFCDLWMVKDRQEAIDRYESLKESIPTDLQPAFKPLTTAVGNWKGEIFAWWDHPVTNAYTEAIAGLVKLTNHTGRGYSFKAIRAKLLYSNLPTFHRPVFDRSLKERPPFMPLGEIKDYGIKFSTLYEMLREV